jgi:hypothetical protein
MGRGAEQQVQQAAAAAQAQQDAMNQQLFQQNQALQSTLVPQYQAILANPGYTDAQKTAITGQTLGSLGSAFDALQQSAQNRLAKTGNSAGFGELEDELARERGRQTADTTQQNQIAFANAALGQQQSALQGLGSLYGVDTNLLGRTLGLTPQFLNVQQQAARGQNMGFRFGLGPFGFSLGG